MSDKQKQARNEYFLIYKLVENWQDMVDELEDYYKKIIQENER